MNICPLTILYKALLNIIGGEGAITNITIINICENMVRPFCCKLHLTLKTCPRYSYNTSFKTVMSLKSCERAYGYYVFSKCPNISRCFSFFFRLTAAPLVIWVHPTTTQAEIYAVSIAKPVNLFL